MTLASLSTVQRFALELLVQFGEARVTGCTRTQPGPHAYVHFGTARWLVQHRLAEFYLAGLRVKPTDAGALLVAQSKPQAEAAEKALS